MTNSSVRLSRDFGNFAEFECLQYQRDKDRIGKEISFQDFFSRLQSGGYSRPTFKRTADARLGVKEAEFCEQIYFDEETAAKVTDKASFDANEKDLMSVRIREVTGAGNFSSDTKAKYTLSLPVKLTYTAGLRQVPGSSRPVMRNNRGRWVITQVQGPPTFVPQTATTEVKTLLLYHPCPVRIENIQYDAVLSLNDPADEDTRVVILVPLKGSNFGTPSEDFFNKIVRQLSQISTPDSITGLFPTADIATGNQWNIESVFSLKPNSTATDGTPARETASPSVVANAFFTWDAAPGYRRKQVSANANEIVYGWEPQGRELRYFMLQYPVNISLNDLSILTRNLPPTPPEKAIHAVPGLPGTPKPLYKKSEPPALDKECGTGIVRERMTNPTDALGSLFSSEDLSDVLKGEDGKSLFDGVDTCDPFAMNAQTAKGFRITPVDAARFFFNFLILIAVALGTWLAMYAVIKNYDGKFASFAADAGKVVGTLALQSSGRVKDAFYRGETEQEKAAKAAKVAEAAEAATAPGLPSSLKNVGSTLGSLIGLKKA